MILEIVGSRVYAPYLGSSIYVWTSLIGIIMGSLSIGYYYGGKLADKGANYKTLSGLIFLAGCFIFLTNIIKSVVLYHIVSIIPDPKIAAIFAGIFLFVFPSILLGMVSPYSVKMRLTSLNDSASTVGNLYAVSTVGSIFGTFIAGFFLISFFGTTGILYILSIILIALSVFIYPEDKMDLKIIMLSLCSVLVFRGGDILFPTNKNFIDVDTKYNRVWIYDDIDTETQRPIRRMSLNRQSASAMFLDGDDLAWEYTKYYNLAGFLEPNLKKALLIGGAAYSYPKEFLKKFPNSTLDVVEIDPDLIGLAKKYFNLKDNERMTVYNEDGRVFLNSSKNKYDVVFVDVYNSDISAPAHLTTVESVQRIYDILNENGVVITNLLTSVKGMFSGFYISEFNTYKKVFPNVYVFKVNKYSEEEIQNLIVIGLKGNENIVFKSSNPEENRMLQNRVEGPELDESKVLTDDYAPVESFFISSTFY